MSTREKFQTATVYYLPSIEQHPEKGFRLASESSGAVRDGYFPLELVETVKQSYEVDEYSADISRT